jgi:hypothetical protein
MIKTIAIPARLQKENLTAAEMEELAAFGDKALTAEELAENEAKEAEAAAREPIEDIKMSIAALEAQQTPELMRKAILGKDAGALAAIEDEIELLKAGLV